MENEPCDLEEELKNKIKYHKSELKFTLGCRWYTPQIYIDAVRELMRDIDIDPATDERVQKRIKAKTYHTDTPEKDAFNFPWYGRMFLNPSYTEGVWERFINKGIDEYLSGNVTEAVILTNTNITGGDCFIRAVNYCNAFCFIHKPVEWIKGHWVEEVWMKRMGLNWNPPIYEKHYNCFIYLGKNKEGFKKIFSRFGVVLYGE